MTSPQAGPWSRAEPLFGQVREDSAIEASLAVRLGARRAFCITSGGCTAFALACAVRDQVVSADVNPAQTALARLKWSLLCNEPDEAVFGAFYGNADSCGSVPDQVTELGREFKTRKWLLRGLHRCGTVDVRLSMLRRCAQVLLISQRRILRLLEKADVESQREAFRREWLSGRLAFAMRLLFSRRVFGFVLPTGGLAVPERLDDWMLGKLERLVTSGPARSNPYAWELLLGEPCPDVNARPVALQGAFQGRKTAEITFRTGNAADCLDGEAPFDLIALSNIGEGQGVEFLESLITNAARSLARGGIVLSRSILPPVEPGMIPGLQRRVDLECEFERADRSAICTGFRIWEKSVR